MVEKPVTNQIRLKEFNTLNDYLYNDQEYSNDNFWWDIENDFYIFFGQKKESLIINMQQALLENNQGYFEEVSDKELINYYGKEHPEIMNETLMNSEQEETTFVKKLFKKRK